VERWVQGESFDLVVASHDGYQRLEPPVMHQRWVFSLRNGIYLVRDVVTGQGKRRLDIAWHLGHDLQPADEGGFKVEGTTQSLLLLPADGHGWVEEVRRENWSPAYGQKGTAAAVNFSADASLPAEFAVMLVTLNGGAEGKSAEGSRGAMSFARMDSASGDAGVVGYRYAGEGVHYSFIVGQGGKSWRMGAVSSDAEFVCAKRASGNEQLMFCGGSYASVEGGLELRCTRSIDWAEVTVKAGARNVFSSDPSAIREPAKGLQPSKPASKSSE
jgi:hypothetical protein